MTIDIRSMGYARVASTDLEQWKHFATKVLGLAEGIESALAATRLTGIPCWATLGAERFGRVKVPPDVRRLVLFLDNDRGGTRAEQLAKAAPQFADLAIEAEYPPRPGADWNDVLRAIA